MRLVCFAAALCLAAVPMTVAAPAPTPKAKTNKEKIVGVWELVDAKSHTTFEFTKNGKLKMSGSVGGERVSFVYPFSVEGDKLKVTRKAFDGKRYTVTITITKLTDKELHIKEEKGETNQFKRKTK